jgi:hypothetical protein
LSATAALRPTQFNDLDSDCSDEIDEELVAAEKRKADLER